MGGKMITRETDDKICRSPGKFSSGHKALKLKHVQIYDNNAEFSTIVNIEFLIILCRSYFVDFVLYS